MGDIIDANLDEFEKSNLSRRQSLVNFIGSSENNNLIPDLTKSLRLPLQVEQNKSELNENSVKNTLEI